MVRFGFRCGQHDFCADRPNILGFFGGSAGRRAHRRGTGGVRRCVSDLGGRDGSVDGDGGGGGADARHLAFVGVRVRTAGRAESLAARSTAGGAPLGARRAPGRHARRNGDLDRDRVFVLSTERSCSQRSTRRPRPRWFLRSCRSVFVCGRVVVPGVVRDGHRLASSAGGTSGSSGWKRVQPAIGGVS